MMEVSGQMSRMDAKTKEVAAVAESLEKRLDAKTKELAVVKEELRAKTEESIPTPQATTLRSALELQEQALAAVREDLKAKTVELDSLKEELKMQTEQVITTGDTALHAALELQEQALNAAREDLTAKTEELVAARAAEADATRQCQELLSKQGAEGDGSPPAKKAKVEAGSTEDMQALLLGEIETMQVEKKGRDKLLKEFKQLAKMPLEQYVESLAAEAEAGKAAKVKGKASTPVAEPKKRAAAVPGTDSAKRQR